jgi:hypothetical protein
MTNFVASTANASGLLLVEVFFLLCVLVSPLIENSLSEDRHATL